jgi:hypothetical protein
VTPLPLHLLPPLLPNNTENLCLTHYDINVSKLGRYLISAPFKKQKQTPSY